MFTKNQLLEMAISFYIDPIFQVSVNRKGEKSWALCTSNRCLHKNTEDWEFEPRASERSEEFTSATRFSSIDDTVNYYISWRKERFFIFAKAKMDFSWNCFCYSKNEAEVRSLWDALSEIKENTRKRHGLWIFTGTEFKIIETYKDPGSSSEGVEFDDIIAKIAL